MATRNELETAIAEAMAAAKAGGGDWQGPAEDALKALLAELVSRCAELKPIELIGAVRAIAEALTTSRAFAPKVAK